MQHDVGKPRHAHQTAPIIEIGLHWQRPGRAQGRRRFRATHQGKNAKATGQPWQATGSHVAAANNQDPFHQTIITRTMTYRISLQPGGHEFDAAPGQTVLEAALAAKLLLPHSCRDGACGACKGKVIDGRVDYGSHSAGALSAAEQAEGYALFCCAKPLSDLVLQARTVMRAGDIPIRKLPCRVHKLQRLADDVMLLDLKLPASEAFRFRAGQYIDILLADGQRRSFSIANAPHDGSHIELHVRRIDGGSFTAHVFERMKEKDILRFEGPLGTFWLREDSQRPIVLVAGSTGFAPIKSIVEHAIETGLQRPINLYWGARERAGLYLDELARSWASALPDLRYIPVLSDAADDLGWRGRRGLVHQAVMDDFADLAGHECYACGAPAMIDAARDGFCNGRGLPADAFFADAFTFAIPAS